MDNSIYTQITEATAYGARDRVLDDLNALTNGEADKAIRYVAEFKELEAICKEIKERKAREAKKNKEFNELVEELEKA